MTGPGGFYAQVHEVQRLSARLIRVILGGEDLFAYPALAAPDESVCLWFPLEGESRPAPVTFAHGRWGHHGPGPAPAGRNYTVRRYDAGTPGVPESARMSVDFVVHAGGVASRWAQSARPGDVVLLSRPRSWYRPPADARWVLAAADLTGLPALARIIEDFDGADGSVWLRSVIEVADADDLAALPAHPRLRISTGTGNGIAASALTGLVAAELAQLTPRGPGYVWFAGDAAQSRQIRKLLRHEHGWGLDRFHTVGYWRAGAEHWNRAYDQVGDRMAGVYQQALDAGRSADEAAEILDLELERAGL